MDFSENKAPFKIIKMELLEELILETFILILMANGIACHRKIFMS